MSTPSRPSSLGLYTLEFHIVGLPTLFHSYPTEPLARQAFHSAIPVMNRANQTILALRLFHKRNLLASAVPTLPAPRPLPPPDSSGVRHCPAASRALKRPSSLYFNSVDRPPPVLDPSTIDF